MDRLRAIACLPPSANFDYLVAALPDIALELKLAEVLAPVDPGTAAVKLRRMLECFVAHVLGGSPRHETLFGALESRDFREALGDDALHTMARKIRYAGNDGAHGRPVRRIEHRLRDVARLAAHLFVSQGCGAAEEVPDFAYVPGATAAAAASYLALSPQRTEPPGPEGSVPDVDATRDWTDLLGPGERYPCPSARAGVAHFIRGRTSTTVLVEHEGEVEVRWRELPSLLFGCGTELWEWEERTTWTSLSAVTDLEAYWDLASEEQPIRRVLAPIDEPRLLNLGTGASFPMPQGASEDDGQPPIRHTRERRPLLSAGPWHLQLTSEHMHSGGVHGDWTCSFDVLRMDGVATDGLLARLSAHFLADAERRAALAVAWKEADEEDGELSYADSERKLTVFEFCFDEVGRVGLRYQWTRDDYYAVSEGGWDAYTTSRWLVSYDLPDFLGVAAAPPESVLRWWRAHPGDFCGWSTISSTIVEDLEARLEYDDGV